MSTEADRGSARLAAAVIAHVTASHPEVVVNLTEERPTQHFSIVNFAPPHADGAGVTLYANYDWSFTLECGQVTLFDDEPMVDEDEGARVALIVHEIDSLAVAGLRRSRLDRLLRPGRRRVGPWRT